MHNLCRVIKDLYIKYEDSIIWITGDFHLPNIDWNTRSVVNNAYSLDICNSLIDVYNLRGFSQSIDTPTQGSNILDFFATNRPNLILQAMVKSGISDHEVICVESMLSAVVLESNPRKVYLWNRADFVEINNKALEYCNYFVSHYTTNTPIEVLWASFKSFCLECLDHIPQKFHKMSNKHPWINSHIIVQFSINFQKFCEEYDVH